MAATHWCALPAISRDGLTGYTQRLSCFHTSMIVCSAVVGVEPDQLDEHRTKGKVVSPTCAHSLSQLLGVGASQVAALLIADTAKQYVLRPNGKHGETCSMACWLMCLT